MPSTRGLLTDASGLTFEHVHADEAAFLYEEIFVRRSYLRAGVRVPRAADGHYMPDHMPYVVAHRHAAGNWSQGVLVIRKDAVHKLERLKQERIDHENESSMKEEEF